MRHHQHSRRGRDAEEPPLASIAHPGFQCLLQEKYEIRDGKVVVANEGPIGIMVTEKKSAPRTGLTRLELQRKHSSRSCGTDYVIHT